MSVPNKTTPIALCLTLLMITTVAFQAVAQKITPRAYIERHKDAAVRYMEEYGCPASIILAVAMHESAYGTSRVARYLNNHFGIKGPNDSKEIRSAYKGYDSVDESYADFIDFLKRRESTEKLFDQYHPHEYQKWVQGIARSGYAQSSSWSSKVLNTIRKYELHALDKQPEASAELAAGVAPQSGAEPEASAAIATVEPDETGMYTVKKGDTLYDIARKYNTTVKTIQRENGLRHARLRIGQQLVL